MSTQGICHDCGNKGEAGSYCQKCGHKIVVDAGGEPADCERCRSERELKLAEEWKRARLDEEQRKVEQEKKQEEERRKQELKDKLAKEEQKQAEQKDNRKQMVRLGIVIGIVLLLGAVIMSWRQYYKSVTREVKLNLYSSKMLNKELMRELAEQFLRNERAPADSIKTSEVETSYGGEKGKALRVEGFVPADSTHLTMEFRFCDSKTAFDSLKRRECHIGLGWRPMGPEEKAAIRKNLDFDIATGGESRWATDAIAVIVNANNPASALSDEQLKKIFTGAIRDWGELAMDTGGRLKGDIQIYVPSEKTEMHEAFINALFSPPLNGGGAPQVKLRETADDTAEDCAAVGDRVAQNVYAIGVVNLPNIRPGTKRITVVKSGVGDAAGAPGARESLSLTRPVYLYKPKAEDVFADGYAERFRSFVVGPLGQKIVGMRKLDSLDSQQADPPEDHEPLDYLELIKDATQVSQDNFKCLFRQNKYTLDSEARASVERMAVALKRLANSGETDIMVFGFADSDGTDKTNLWFSNKRAEVVAAELRKRDIPLSVIKGFGASVPKSKDTTDEGKRQNRRVEIWYRR